MKNSGEVVSVLSIFPGNRFKAENFKIIGRNNRWMRLMKMDDPDCTWDLQVRGVGTLHDTPSEKPALVVVTPGCAENRNEREHSFEAFYYELPHEILLIHA